MTTKRITPLRQRMIEDMNARKLCAGTQRGHILACKRFAAFLKRSPDTALRDDIRGFQLHLADTGMSICNRNRIMTGLRFLFRVTLRRLDLAAAKLMAARDRWAKVSGKAPSIVLCYEAGYDAFWLARFLKARGIECLVVDSARLPVNRRSRWAETARIVRGKLLRAVIAWCGGERHVWSVVRTPSVDEEDLRRSHRERGRLITERTAHINRIKGLLFAQGIRGIDVKARYKTLEIDKLVTGEGQPP